MNIVRLTDYVDGPEMNVFLPVRACLSASLAVSRYGYLPLAVRINWKGCSSGVHSDVSITVNVCKDFFLEMLVLGLMNFVFVKWLCPPTNWRNPHPNNHQTCHTNPPPSTPKNG